MTRRLLVLCLLAGVLLGVLVAPAVGRPELGFAASAKPRSTVTVHVATASPQVGELVWFAGTAKPGGARPVRIQQRINGRWVTANRATSTATGRFRIQIRPAVAGTATFRAFAPKTSKAKAAASAPVQVTIADAPSGDCAPSPAPVDPQADESARCALARLDSWTAGGEFAAGQMLGMYGSNWNQPLTALGGRSVGVVGFDAAELLGAQSSGTDRVPALIDLARGGSLLTATWHVGNPWTGGGYGDRADVDLPALLDTSNAGQQFYRRFWVDGVDAVAAQFARFADAEVPVLFRPLHEASGSWFWWGAPDPSTYKRLWQAIQDRFAADGVHNVIWVFAAGGSDVAATSLVPDADIGGIDTYDCEQATGFCSWATNASADKVDLSGYSDLAAMLPRMALTEVGPFYSDGSWDPAVISRAIASAGIHPAYALLWNDDDNGLKQISSLTGGLSWLDSCPGGLCSIG